MPVVVESYNTWTLSSSQTNTESFTCPSATDLLVIVFTSYKVGPGAESYNIQCTNVTFDGSSLTEAADIDYPTTNRNRRVQIWYIVNPTTGSSETISVYVNQTDSRMTAIALSGVDTSDPLGVTHTAYAANTTDYVESITTDSNNSLLIAGLVVGANSDISLTEDSNTTEIYYEDTTPPIYNGLYGVGYRLCGSAGSFDIGWTGSGVSHYCFAAAEFQEAVAGGGNVLPQAMNIYRRRRL